MLREPPKGRRYSKEAADTWQREGRYSESRAKGNGEDGETEGVLNYCPSSPGRLVRVSARPFRWFQPAMR